MRMPASVGRVTETKVKGQDYDALIHLGEVGNVPIEVKHKQEDTPYSASTVHSTLKAAARQLPKGQVGWLFLHIPLAWMGPRLEAEYADVLHEALRQTSRVGAVFTAIDKPHVDDARGTAGVRRVWQFWGHEKASEAMWDACLLLKELLDAELDFVRPPCTVLSCGGRWDVLEDRAARGWGRAGGQRIGSGAVGVSAGPGDAGEDESAYVGGAGGPEPECNVLEL